VSSKLCVFSYFCVTWKAKNIVRNVRGSRTLNNKLFIFVYLFGRDWVLNISVEVLCHHAEFSRNVWNGIVMYEKETDNRNTYFFFIDLKIRTGFWSLYTV
jgi:hypothetical protein